MISKKTKASLLSVPGAWLFLIPLRLFNVWNSELKTQIISLTRWGFSSRELTNYSYHCTEASTKRLAIILSRIDGVATASVMDYCVELTRASVLQNVYSQARFKEKFLCNLTDDELRAGRRILYYCLVRILKPRVVFEAGTAHGIGSLLILHALKLNRKEGYPGTLTTIDINPNAGKLLKHMPSDYAELLNPMRGDSEHALHHFPSEIDLFFHDTVNVPSHENNHYALLRSKLSRVGVICTSWGMAGTLADFSEKHRRAYLEFTHQPDGHWSRDTMGISFPVMLTAPSVSIRSNMARESESVTGRTFCFEGAKLERMQS